MLKWLFPQECRGGGIKVNSPDESQRWNLVMGVANVSL
jgi:hypothetical protein